MARLKKIIFVFVGLAFTCQGLVAQLTCKDLAREIAKSLRETQYVKEYQKKALRMVIEQQGLTYDEKQKKIKQIYQEDSALHQRLKDKKEKNYAYAKDFEKNNCDERLVREAQKKLEPEFPHI